MSFWSRIERRIEEITDDLLPDEFSDKLAKARRTLGDGNLGEAKYRLLALTQDRAEHAGAQVLLGTTLLRLQEPDPAFAAFDQALKNSKGMPEALLGRGWAGLALKMYRASIADFIAARENSAGDRELLVEAYMGLGAVYRSQGSLDKAIRELRKAVAESNGAKETIAALGEALSADDGGSTREAKRILTRLIEGQEGPSIAWLALGRIALRDEDACGAIKYFETLVNNTSESNENNHREPALIGLGHALILRQDGEAAQRHLEQALLAHPRDAEALRALAEALNLQGNAEEALLTLQKSLDIQDDLSVAKQGLALALQTSRIDAGVRFANRVLTSEPSNADALTARGLDLAHQKNYEAARATYRLALKNSEGLETLLALGQLELSIGNTKEAYFWSKKALHLDPAGISVRNLLSRCGAAALGLKLESDCNWYDLAEATRHLCATQPQLATLVPDANTAATEYDQPLLVAVMGEFSSGKSSFVNAFLGANIAPTGITPTTSTVNILKYGREQSGRVVYRDNTSRELTGDSMSKNLSEIGEHEARRIRHIEILMPMETLQRINIVDTPGLNSILPEHEAVARSFLLRADAVVWLFTANQAGKSSEKRALDSICEQGVRILGVLNKIDQLTDTQVLEVLTFVSEELGDRVEICVPVSTQRAMASEPKSGWENLYRELDARFFEQARNIKRQALDRRLKAIIEEGRNLVKSQADSHEINTQTANAAAKLALSLRMDFVDNVVERERASINRDAGLLYHQAAREILELVRPRKLPFGSHKTEKADREYLLGLLDSGYEVLLRKSRDRCFAVLRRSANQVFALLPDADLHDLSLQQQIEASLLLVDSEVFGVTRSFLRGFLRGGFINQFFDTQLPSIELQEETIYHALFRGAPEVDREFAAPLAKTGGALLGNLEAHLLMHANRASAQEFEVRAGVERGLLDLEAKRESLKTRMESQTERPSQNHGRNQKIQ